MRFIRAIRIQDFRSLSDVSLESLDNIVPIIGPNGSGKSNLLRALNLFFNGQVEADVPLDLARDFHDPEKKRKVKKQIRIELDLAFGPKLRDELRQVVTKLAGGADVVTVRRLWTLSHSTREPTMELSFGVPGQTLAPVSDADRALVERLVALVRFRYISNHIHPTEILRQEEENLRRALFRRLGRSPSFAADQIDKIRETAVALMEPIADELKVSAAQVRNVELGTPTEWGEVLWAFGLRLQTGETTGREAVLHGSGVQAALAYAILHMLDQDIGSDFGWRRGAIWAVEEPESFLHADLQAQLAESFSHYSNSERLQILFTTHNTAFLGVADSGVAVRMPGTASAVTQEPRTDLIDTALTGGVAPFTHPLHVGSIRPMLLVEGRDDRELLTRAYNDSGMPCPYDILASEDIDPSMSGGVEQIKTYLGNNRSALRARPLSSPVIVLLDHEVPTGRRDSMCKILAEHPSSACHLMPKVGRTPGLKDDVPGIEAYLSLDFYRAAEQEIDLQLITPSSGSGATWSLGVEKSELGERKQDIHKLLRDRGDSADIAALTALVPSLTRLLTDPQGTLDV
jgi:energy-coupling factor transporter ATP-binding protein EcfA2